MFCENSKLLVIPFPRLKNHPQNAQPVEKKASAISTMMRTKTMTEKVWGLEGIDTKITLCIAHNYKPVTFI